METQAGDRRRTELDCDCNNHVPFIDCSKVHDPPAEPTRVRHHSADTRLNPGDDHVEPRTQSASPLYTENVKTAAEKSFAVQRDSVKYSESSPDLCSGSDLETSGGTEPECSRTNGGGDAAALYPTSSGDSDEYSDQHNTPSDLYPAVTHDTSTEYSGTPKTSGMYLELPTRPRSRSSSPGRVGEKSKSSRRVSVADIKYTSVSSIYVNDVYMNPTVSCDTLDNIEMVDNTDRAAGGAGDRLGFQQICVEIDSEETSTHPATFRSAPKSVTGGGRRSRRRLNLAIICLAKLVDLVLHGMVFGFFIYATYLSVIFCHQEPWSSFCEKNSSSSPVILNKIEWKMTVREWSLIFSIFHSVYFLMAALADLAFFYNINNLKKYLLTILPIERGFLLVLLSTDAILYLSSGNLGHIIQGHGTTVFLVLALILAATDTIIVLPRLRYLARQDLVWLRKSTLFFSKWRPCLHFVLVVSLTLYNFLLAQDSRLSLEVVPLVSLGAIYAIIILVCILLLNARSRRLRALKAEAEGPEAVRLEGGENKAPAFRLQVPDLVLGMLGLVSINYFVVAAFANTLNFTLNSLNHPAAPAQPAFINTTLLPIGGDDASALMNSTLAISDDTALINSSDAFSDQANSTFSLQ